MLTLVGPHNAATFCNIPRCIEQNVDWVTGLLRHMPRPRRTRVEATPEAEAEWSRHIEELADGMLYSQIDSWATGVNTNVEGETCAASCNTRAARRRTGLAATRWPRRAMRAWC